MGVLEAPLHISFIMGVLGGIPPTARNLAPWPSRCPAGSHWGVIGISRVQWTLVAAALTLGGDVRVGLEDNFYLPDGDDGALQRRAVAKARQIDRGRRPAAGDRRAGARCCLPGGAA